MLTSARMQLQSKPRKLQVYGGIKVISTRSPTLTRIHTPHHSLPLSPTPLQPTSQIPELPPIKFNALTVKVCMHHKFVKYVTGWYLQQFELDTHSHTPRRHEQLGVTGMPSNQHDTAHVL